MERGVLSTDSTKECAGRSFDTLLCFICSFGKKMESVKLSTRMAKPYPLSPTQMEAGQAAHSPWPRFPHLLMGFMTLHLD